MSFYQKIINVCLAIIITLLIYMIETLEDKVSVLEETLHQSENIFENTQMNASADLEDIYLNCTIANAINIEGLFDEFIEIRLSRKNDNLSFNNLIANGNGTNYYLSNENDYMYWAEDSDLSYMLNSVFDEFHIHNQESGMVVYKCIQNS